MQCDGGSTKRSKAGTDGEADFRKERRVVTVSCLVTTVRSLTLRHMLRRGLRMLRRLSQGTIVLAAVALFVFAWRGDGAWFDKHVFLPQQFFIPASRGIVVWSRTAAATIAKSTFCVM